MGGKQHSAGIPKIRFNLELSEPLVEELQRASEDTGRSFEEVVRKALTLYLACRDGVKVGQKVGLVSPTTGEVVTEFVNV